MRFSSELKYGCKDQRMEGNSQVIWSNASASRVGKLRQGGTWLLKMLAGVLLYVRHLSAGLMVTLGPGPTFRPFTGTVYLGLDQFESFF